MDLHDIVTRSSAPQPWIEGDNIPWNDPGFSARMLREHLTQDHDLASRRLEKIDQHVKWIHEDLLDNQSNSILDLGCGPGLYTSRLAQKGHTCTGIDFSPASIEYARAQKMPGCTYLEGDARRTDFGVGYDLVMFIFGEFNVFTPAHGRMILQKAASALAKGGTLLLEVHHHDAVRNMGLEAPSWFSSDGGLFSDRPHIVLMDNHWDETSQAATQRYYVIDAETGTVDRYAASYQSYTNSDYTRLLTECGFEDIRFYPALGRSSGDPDPTLIAISARKKPQSFLP
jgi:SAM-dependent methyltransferase